MKLTTNARLAILESKVSSLQKANWVLIFAILGKAGVEYLPKYILPILG